MATPCGLVNGSVEEGEHVRKKKSALVQPICYSVAKALTRAYMNGLYEGHRHSLLKLIERSVQVEYLHNLWK